MVKALDALLDTLARNAAVLVVDVRHGFTMEFSSSPAEHKQEYEDTAHAIRSELDASRILSALSQPQGELREALIAAKRALEIVVPSGEHGRQVKAEAVATIDAALAGRTAG
jgi:hypothetical protein